MRPLIISLVILATAIPAAASAGVIGRPTNNLGLIGYWALNEGTGTTVADLSGNRRNGTFSNSPTWVNGKFGKALDFVSASQQRVEINSLLDTPSVVTLSAWVNLDGGSPHATAVAIGNYVTLHARSFGDIEGAYYRGGAQWNYMRAGGDIAGTGWRHIAYVADPANGDQRLYLDGEQIFSDTLTNAIVWTGLYSITTIGDNSDVISEYFLDGRVDEVRIYNRSLTAAEIAALYKSNASTIGYNSVSLDTGSVLKNGLVGHWTFDQKDITTNAILDKSGYGNNGGFLGGSTSSAKAAGKLGQGIKFSDPSHQIRIPNDADISPPVAGTVSAWVKDRITRTGAWQVFVSKYNCITDRDGYALVKQPDNTFMLYLGTTTEAQGIGSNSSFTDRGWHHVVGTWTGTTGSLYVDGVLASAPQAMTWSPRTNTEPLTIGSCDVGYEYDGTVDDVRVYNRALSATEVAQLYRTGTSDVNASVSKLQTGSSLTSGLVGHWTFDNLDVTDKVYDKTGTGNHAYFYGGSTSSAKVAGKLGQALRFDGVDDRLRFANGTYGMGTVHTASVWLDFEDSVDGVVLGQAAGEYLLYLDQTDVYYNATDNFVNVPHGGLDGWHHLSVVRNGTSVTFYKDGVQLSTPQTLGANTALIISSIGAHSLGAFPMLGKIDDVRLYNRALSAAEVKQLYNLGK